jgi:hypothetical protein
MSSTLDHARQLAIAQDFGSEALRLNEELVAANPADDASRTRLARCYREAGRLDDSEAQYREVLRSDPRNRIASGGLLAIEGERRRATAPPDPPPLAPRPRRPPGARAPDARRRADHPTAPLAFTGFDTRDFAELRFCDARDVRARFGPRVVDLVKRVNALTSSEEIAAVREEGRRQLFRASRTDVQVDVAHWSVHNAGGRREPQFTIAMDADRGRTADCLRVGISFDLADDDGQAGGAAGLEAARRHFRRFQDILGSSSRSLFLGWMIKENGLVEIGRRGPRADLHEPTHAVEELAACDASGTSWVFFGKWLSAGQTEDAAVLADPVELVRTIDRVFTGLLPLWRAMWRV